MTYIDRDEIPDFLNVEDAVHYLVSRDDKYCPDKIRLLFAESEGTTCLYGMDEGKPRSMQYKVRRIVGLGLCYTDARFETGWIERDGTCRSNNYGCHDAHLMVINREMPDVERLGWIHVSTDICTNYFIPSSAQVREMKRIGKWYNEGRAAATRRFVPVKPDVPLSEQYTVMFDNL